MVDRADRILDAAESLLLHLGYRKVTVDDIAVLADVGKGTIYLHWRTKDELFEALLLRDGVRLIEENVAALHRDPAEVLPHRLASRSFSSVQRRPLLRGLFSGDMELLGRLLRRPPRRHDLLGTESFFDVAARFGLFRTDVPNVHHTYSAITLGFYLMDGLDPGTLPELGEEDVAESIAFTVRHALEPPDLPSETMLAAAAAEHASSLQGLITAIREWIYRRKASSP